MRIEDITGEILKEHIDKIVDITLDVIKENKITVLTGANGTGKSLIRKLMSNRMHKYSNGGRVQSVSMQLRTELRSEWGALSSAAHDTPTCPTSISTKNLIDGLIGDVKKDSFIVIDEPEIGMSSESQLGFAEYLSKNMKRILENSRGVLIITHSETLVRSLKDKDLIDTFVYLDYNSYHTDIDSWLERGIVPTDFEFLEKWSSSLFKAVLHDSDTDRKQKREERLKDEQ